jgi:hypothetical protein
MSLTNNTIAEFDSTRNRSVDRARGWPRAVVATSSIVSETAR